MVESLSPAGTGTGPALVEVSFANTNYRVRLEVSGEFQAPVGARVLGVIRANVQRVDVVRTGGAFLEPVYGRPRRLQGRVIGADAIDNVLVIDGPVPMHCHLTDRRQKAADFEVGVMVTCGVQDGATFEPVQE